MQAQKVLGNKWTEIAVYCNLKKDKNEICELRFMAYVFLGLATIELTMQ